MEFVAKVDSRGRVLIPKEVREKLKIRGMVKLRVEGNKLILVPITDPLEELTANVVRGTINVAQEIREFRRVAEEEALRRLKERWS